MVGGNYNRFQSASRSHRPAGAGPRDPNPSTCPANCPAGAGVDVDFFEPLGGRKQVAGPTQNRQLAGRDLRHPFAAWFNDF